MYTLYLDGNPKIKWFSRFPDSSPIFPNCSYFLFFGIFGQEQNGEIGWINQKPGRYVITHLFSYVLAKTEWKNLFCSSSYPIFKKMQFFIQNPSLWWHHKPLCWRHQNLFHVNKFLSWWSSIVVSFVSLALSSQKLLAVGTLTPPPKGYTSQK